MTRFPSGISPCVRWFIACVMLTGAAIAAGQTSKAAQSGEPQVKVGILPFMDVTASGGRDVGTAVGRTMQAEMTHSTNLSARMLSLDSSERPEELDGEKAIEKGRREKVDLVFIGSVLEAKTEESTKGGWLPRIQGQSVNVRVRSVKARVTLQGELYDVASGRRLTSLRVTGNESDSKFGGTLWTTLGSWDATNDRAFLESPMGKALQQAIRDIVKKIAAARR